MKARHERLAFAHRLRGMASTQQPDNAGLAGPLI